MSVTDILRNVYIDHINPTGPNKVANKDAYDMCSIQLRMTCAGDTPTTILKV